MLQGLKQTLNLRPKQWALVQDLGCILVLLLFTLVIAPFFTNESIQDSPPIEAGEVDLTGWNPEEIIELKGEWDFFWQKFADEIEGAEPTPLYVPGYWSSAEPPFPRQGYVTYRLIMTGLAPGSYEFHVPSIYAASTIRLDGELLSSIGELGRNEDEARTVWREHSVNFVSDGAPHEILIEISAYHHRSNGLEVAPILGESGAVAAYKILYTAKDMFFQAATVILSLYGFTIYLFRREDKSSLYFGIFTAGTAISMLVMGVNFVELVYTDIAFWKLLFILYVPYAIAYATLGRYFGALYPDESITFLDNLFTINFLGIAVMHTFLILSGKTMMSSFVIPWLTVSSAPLFLYILYIMVCATIAGREGALVLLCGTLIFVLLLANDSLVESNVIHRDQTILYGLGEVGFVVFLLTQVMV